MKSYTYGLFLIGALCIAQTPAPPPPQPAAPTAPAPQTPAKPPSLEDIPGADPVVLSVGDEKMTKSEYERLIATLPEQVRTRANGPEKRKIAEQIVQLKALSQEAKRRGVDKNVEVKEMIVFQTENLLASTLAREVSATINPDDAAAQGYYEQHKADFDQVTASHILIRYKGSPVPVRAGQKDLTPEEALAKATDIRKRIAGGEDFAKIAEAESDDTQTGKKGGSLGSFAKGNMVAEFEEAVFKQPIGQISDPVKTKFGYHIIRVDKHEAATFEAAKPQILKKLKPELTQKALDDIRNKAAVTINDAYFGK